MTWTCTVLGGPKGKPACKALGFAGGIVVGTTAGGSKTAPVWWPGGKGTSIAVEGLKDYNVHGGGGAQIAGYVQKRMNTEAAFLTIDGEALAVTNLHTKAFDSTRLHASDGTRQVGSGTRKGSRLPQALVWRGTADSVTVLEPPESGASATARGIDGEIIVGDWEGDRPAHACMWRGTTVIDLHPADETLYGSECIDVSGDVQVGGALTRKNVQRAFLWRGSAASVVDLTPHDAKGALARACAGDVQVGWRSVDAEHNITQAILWKGSAAETVDLHALVPTPYNVTMALGVIVDGNRVRVAGTAMHYENRVNMGERALLWEGP